MNVETGEVKPYSQLTEEEKKSGKWVPAGVAQIQGPKRQRHKAEEREMTAEHHRRGKNDNYPGCTTEFVNKVRKRRAKNKLAKQARKRNRK